MTVTSSSASNPAAVANARVKSAIFLCVRAAAVKDVAATLPPNLQSVVTHRADLTINNIIDDFCGTTVPFVPGPWPSPSPLALELATRLTMTANMTVQTGKMRHEIMQIAKRLIEKAYETAGL